MEPTKVLCVDDEPNVIGGLRLQLRRDYVVTPALNATEGIAALKEKGPFAVVLSDMRMPGMDGATFLSVVRDIAPDSTRMLLTGQADVHSAIAAVNSGQVFRFLTKPISPEQIRAAFKAAVEQHLLVTGQRQLLEQTLHGSVRALVDILSLTSPDLFGRATRVRHLVTAACDHVHIDHRWQVEMAAMLYQIGAITLPNDVAGKWSLGQKLAPHEDDMARRVPTVTDKLLANIPRLDDIRAMIQCAARPPEVIGDPNNPEQRHVILGSQLLRAALVYDANESQGKSVDESMDVLRASRIPYDAAILNAIAAVVGGKGAEGEMREVTVGTLQEGMILAEDVRTTFGMLLAARGLEVTVGFIERAKNYTTNLDKGRVRVFVRTT